MLPPPVGAQGINGTPIVRFLGEVELEESSRPDKLFVLDKTLHDFEVLLGPSGWIPGWSTATGALELLFGLVMIVVSLGASLYERMQGFCTANVIDKERHYRQATSNLVYALHGLSHLLRATISIVPIVGNAILYIYDQYHRYEYPTERARRRV